MTTLQYNWFSISTKQKTFHQDDGKLPLRSKVSPHNLQDTLSWPPHPQDTQTVKWITTTCSTEEGTFLYLPDGTDSWQLNAPQRHSANRLSRNTCILASCSHSNQTPLAPTPHLGWLLDLAFAPAQFRLLNTHTHNIFKFTYFITANINYMHLIKDVASSLFANFNRGNKCPLWRYY